MAGQKTNKWGGRDGFLCALALIVVSFLSNEVFWIADRNSHSIGVWLYSHRNFFEASLFLIQSALSLLVVIIFARSRSSQQLLNQFGMRYPVTPVGFFATFPAIGIGLLALYGVEKQWVPPVHLFRDFFYQGGMARWFFIVYAVVIAPCCEEFVRRGFLYRAFRGSFDPLLSIFFVLCVHAYFHWGTITQSFYGFVCLELIEIWLCLILEWTGNLWNCILCHVVYNATQNLAWYIYTPVLILFIPYFIRRFSGQYKNWKHERMETS